MTVHNWNQVEKEPCQLKVKLKVGACMIHAKPLFTHDSTSVIISHGCDLKVFNIASGECIQTLMYHKAPVIAIRHNRNNTLQIISCSNDGVIVRWDLSDGKTLQVANCGAGVTAFFAPSVEGPWYFIKRTTDQFHLFSMDAKEGRIGIVERHILPWNNQIAFSSEGKFVAMAMGLSLIIQGLSTSTRKRHLVSRSQLTCVTFHPSELVVATGDDAGKILIWSDILISRPIKTIFHWHSLPVADLVFSTSGSYLYSGGGEAALVKWNVFSATNAVVPRLGSPICGVATSPDSSYVLTVHEDNGLQVIDSCRKIVQSIQGLTRSYFRGSGMKKILPTGMLHDPGTGALVMNGKPGHLQFYDVNLDKQLFNLDITSKNILSQERDTDVYNIDVQCAAFDSHGTWLATAEFWHDGKVSPQVWLKFWKFDTSKSNFVLNTNVILPHEDDINCIAFRPTTAESSMAVTCSKDRKLKVWGLEVLDNGKESWTCNAMACYRDLPVVQACFSEEGSVMAVDFSGVATLWTVDPIALKEVLYNEKAKGNLKQLIFGRGTYSHYLICHNGTSIIVWNVISLTISWMVHSEVQTFALDPISGLIAAFSQNQNLIIFKPSSPHPVFFLENVSKKPIMCALFIPIANPSDEESSCFHCRSRLFFLDQDQNLFTLTDEPDIESEWNSETDKKITVNKNVPLTPFGMLKAETSVTDVITAELSELDINLNNNMDLMDISSPTLMDPVALCTAILPTLLIPAKTAPKTTEEAGKPEISHSEKEESKSKDVHHPLSNENFFTDFSFLQEVFKSKSN